MTLREIGATLERGDPDRWRAAMTAPPPARPALLGLYGFNLEIARAPWITSDPLLAEIRLRWWADAIDEIYDGRAPRRHDIVLLLAETVRTADLPHRLFQEMIAARLADAAATPHADRSALELYIDHTAGHLMELAARALGAEGAALPVVRDFGRGAGIAALLRALPELRRRGRDPVPPDVTVQQLAQEGLQALARARSRRDRVPRAAAPALLAGWKADRLLRRAASGPAYLMDANLEPPEILARGALAWRAFSGRW